MSYASFIADTLAFDLEITRSGKRISHVGARFGERSFSWQRSKGMNKALDDLDDFGRGAGFVLGHNLFNHDLPHISTFKPDMAILCLPVIDTLFLSPLAFPRNPYHRLVKDYKLVRSAVNDPMEDVRLALEVFKDQWESLTEQGVETPGLLDFYHFCFSGARFGAFTGKGIATVLEKLGARQLPSAAQAAAVFERLSEGSICRHSVKAVQGLLEDEASDKPAAAYALAWLRVAGSNSVLPPWVRHQFPAVIPLLKTLRDIPCGRADCTYCSAMHDPDSQLGRFFGYDGFRAQPRTEDGESLQRAVTLNGLQDTPLLAILPTGGGKSICYQLPALVRHMRRGLLTVVISPLQALMKDQVDNLVKNTGTPFAAAIYGLLTPPERGEVIERVRLGDIAILYISPEQLRSRSVRQVLAQREIGCWVFDEAHCLSKWGHDFRPDYLYAARFIREFSRRQKLPLPPVTCYTATAKLDVIEEICNYFEQELQQSLTLFEGGVERDNLHFDIEPVTAAEKLSRTLSIVEQHLQDDRAAAIIVYAARRKTTEEIRDYLVHQGVTAEAFHAGLAANEKRRIIEEFVAGEIPVICATNAFGMGIDKENIRLVLHYDLPGSLENYLQEAGRAGRDLKPAHCILLYDPEDAETQFKLNAFSEIGKQEIQRILTCLRRTRRDRNKDIVITTQELLREEDLAGLFDKTDSGNDTRIRTAVSWLERADFLERNENMTQVFQGKPRVKSLAEAEPIIDRLKLSPTMRRLWHGILQVIFNTPVDQGLSADDVAEQLFDSARELKNLEKRSGLTPAQLVIYAMHDMAAAGLMDRGMLLSAFIQPRGRKSAPRLLDTVCALEERLLKFLQEEAPDAEEGLWVDLDLGRLNQRLQNDGQESNPVTLRNLIKGLAYDGKGMAGARGSIELKHMGRNRYRVALQRSWQALQETAALRRNVAHLILGELMAKIRSADDQPRDDDLPAGDLLVEFSANALADAIAHDLFLHAQVRKPLAAIDRALMFLHEHKIITLQNGLAVFRQAMTIRLNADNRRRYTKGDFDPLAAHYSERRFQVHVIMAYAHLAMEKVTRALGLVLDYFAMPRERFVRHYFAEREEILQRATSVESYRQIVERLNNPVQISIVGSPVHANRLVLAGPGSGKTRVVVHRCAYLLRVERIAAHRILVMCFNHNAAVALRRRLNELVGRDARGVTVATYHGAAMRLAGINLRERMTGPDAEGIDFDDLIRTATALLKGETEVPGLDPDEVRDQILQGFSHILVDEYQDIDQDQYDLVSAIAGRTLAEADGRLAIMAVGDDDQNIYAFKGANVAFIRQFQADYRAGTVFMTANYRSSGHIIRAANQLIAGNRDRMKTDHPIRVNRQRKSDPPGGVWEERDTVARGRVQIMEVAEPARQAGALYHELMRLRSLDPDLQWSQVAVLGRTHDSLTPVRALLEEENVPLKYCLKNSLPLHRIREVQHYLKLLQESAPLVLPASELTPSRPGQGDGGQNHLWHDLLSELHADYVAETADAPLPVQYALDWFYEALAEQRREKSIGSGVFLNTVHGAKGLEFDHVFILDGDWRRPEQTRGREEERRLLYVGMTRARQTLCVMENRNEGNPFLGQLQGNHVFRRPGAHPPDGLKEATPQRYHLAGLQDLFLSYAAGYTATHPIHRHLAAIDVGDPVFWKSSENGITVHDRENFPIARLSREGNAAWRPQLSQILEIRIVGMITRHADDSRETYREHCRCDTWEVPLMEVALVN